MTMISDIAAKTRRLVTMRELNQRTSEVMNEIVDDGDPTMVTRYGRPVAVILPMTPGAESVMIGRLVESTVRSFADDETASLDDVARGLDLDPDVIRLKAEVAEE